MNGSLSAADAIAAVTVAAEQLAAATRAEMEIEINRADAKSAAISRLMQLENPETKKLHSASSAEKVVELDPAYHDYCIKKVDCVVATIIARGAYDSAKLMAQLAIIQAMPAEAIQ